MKTYIIEYQDKGEVKAEIVRAATSTSAVKVLCDKLRRAGRPMSLELVSVKRFA